MPETPLYAVVLKIHFWDDFAERQLARLRRHAGTDNLFVVVDETNGLIPNIRRHDRVIRMTDQTAAAEGFLLSPKNNVFWHNTDYQLYHFIDLFPQFAYIVTVEYDFVVNVDIANIVQTMAARSLDFIGEPLRGDPATWPWRKFTTPYYPENFDFVGRLLCFAVFSRTFALQLQASRRDHANRFLNHEITHTGTDSPWPISEGFVGAEIARLGAPTMTLAEFGDVTAYDWAPARPEPQLPELSAFAFIHPLLDVPRFIRSSLKLKVNNPEDIFNPRSFLGGAAMHCDTQSLIPPFLRYFASQGNFEAVARLRLYAEQRGADPAVFNVARGKPATQSSTSDHSRAQTTSGDAAGAVNGVIDGSFGFHTGLDAPPWWCVDLEALYPVREIRVYNRLDVPHRARSLIAASSEDMIAWTIRYRHPPDENFGGADGRPLAIRFPEPITMRFLRLQLAVREVLHLDEVEVLV